MYKITFRGRADRQFQQIPPPHFRRIEQAIDGLANDPRPHGAIKLTGETGYRLRIGDYRILYDIDDTAQVITIYRVGHRREVYR